MTVSETFLHIVLLCGGLLYGAACAVALFGNLRPRPRRTGHVPDVSVVIAARNEEEHIGELLNDLIGQDYPSGKLDIVVVDDCSADGTSGIVEHFSARDVRIRYIDVRQSDSPYSHKKRAIHAGVTSSGGDIILITDADCRVTPGWVSGMAGYFAVGIDLVAGAVIPVGGGISGRFEALEMAGIQAMSAGLMDAGFPVTCNGANLAYRREAFERVGGFDGIGRLVSGDDDLLMQKIARGNPSGVVYVTGADCAVRTRAGHGPVEYVNRRARWTSKILHYPSKAAVLMLAGFFVFFAAVPVGIVLAGAGMIGWGSLVWSLGLKAAGDALLTSRGVLSMKRPWLMALFPLAWIVHIPYIVTVVLKGVFGSFEWRGRLSAAVSAECGEQVHD